MPIDAANVVDAAPLNLRAQPQSTFQTTGSTIQHYATIVDGPSSVSMNPPTSSSNGSVPVISVDSIAKPESVYSTTSKSVDHASISSLASTESSIPHTDLSLAVGHGSMSTSPLSDRPSRLQAQDQNFATQRDGSLSTFSSGIPLTAANLRAHAMVIPPPPSRDTSVKLWLAEMGGAHPLDVAGWAQLVSTDPLAADIEAAIGVGHHNVAEKDG